MSQLPTPNYIKAVKIINKSEWTVEVVVNFQSNHVSKVPVESGEIITVQHDINKGSFIAVDPVVSGKVLKKGCSQKVLLSFNNEDVEGVVVRTFTINPEMKTWPIKKSQNNKYIHQVIFVNESQVNVHAILHFSWRQTIEYNIGPGVTKIISSEEVRIQGVPKFYESIEYGILTANLLGGPAKIIQSFDGSDAIGRETREYVIKPDLKVVQKSN